MPSAAGIIRESILGFLRLQNWMQSVKDKDPGTYQSMHGRDIEMKVTLVRLGVKLKEIEHIKD